MMKFVYVCTNYNNSDFSIAAIKSFLKNIGHELRVYVVDNASHSDELDKLNQFARTNPCVRIISSQKNLGYFSGLNLGITAARNDDSSVGWMIIGNNDLEFSVDFCDMVKINQDHYCQYSVVSPDIITLDGTHQNPHVISNISLIRRVIYDIYYSNYLLSVVMHKIANIFNIWFRRGDSNQWAKSQSIAQGHGSCYLLTPKFFSNFENLWAPSFLMAEEAFLNLQLINIGETIFYSPAISVKHHCHASLKDIPNKIKWGYARDAHHIYRKYVKLFSWSGQLSSPKHKRSFQICSRCVMDTSDSAIVFDSRGICDHCNTFDKKIKSHWNMGEGLDSDLKTLVTDIKASGRGRDFDCIIGMSGGIDSSYLTYIATKLGLRPLVFHVDAGWNSELAVSNIEKLVDKLGVDLYTEVIDWEEMRDLQLAYFKSGVPHIDTPQDHAFFATMYKFAEKNNIKYILTGANLSTECIRNPIEWMYYQSDSIQLRDIHAKFGFRPLVSYPITSILYHKIFLPYFKGVKVVRPLDMLPYDKSKAAKLLIDKFGWQPYPQKHFESRFTRFYEGYWLPTKFGYDTRRVQYSSLINTGQMTRNEALERLTAPSLDALTARQELEYVANKLQISATELRGYLYCPNMSFRDYKSQENLYALGAKIMKMLGMEIGGKR
jgi:N-acetyl sugar amidotransferase